MAIYRVRRDELVEKFSGRPDMPKRIRSNEDSTVWRHLLFAPTIEKLEKIIDKYPTPDAQPPDAPRHVKADFIIERLEILEQLQQFRLPQWIEMGRITLGNIEYFTQPIRPTHPESRGQ